MVQGTSWKRGRKIVRAKIPVSLLQDSLLKRGAQTNHENNDIYRHANIEQEIS